MQCLNIPNTGSVKLNPAMLSPAISFQNTFKLRPNSYVPGNISLMPGIEVQIKASAPAAAVSGTASNKSKKGASSGTNPSGPVVLDGFAASLESGGKLVVTCTVDGITHQAVAERRERQLARQKRAAKRRRREEKERHERRAVREAEREQERLQRLAERKARKLAEREARRRRAELASGLSASSKGGIKSSNSLTRLEAEGRSGKASPSVHAQAVEPLPAPVARRPKSSRNNAEAPQTPPRAEPAAERPSDASYVTAVTEPAAPAPGSGFKPPRGAQGTPILGMGGVGANAGAELMAAMARRRAKNQED